MRGNASISRRGVLATIPALGATVMPVAASALPLIPVDDPIIAAIAAAKEARMAFDVAFAARQKLEDEAPKDIRHEAIFDADDMHIAVGHFNGSPLWIRTEDELSETLTKKYIALLLERNVSFSKWEMGKPDTPEQTWLEVEISSAKKYVHDVMERRERGRRWREETGLEAAAEACRAATEALVEAEKALVEAEPTTSAGLIAALEYLQEADCLWDPELNKQMSAVIVNAARKLLLA